MDMCVRLPASMSAKFSYVVEYLCVRQVLFVAVLRCVCVAEVAECACTRLCVDKYGSMVCV